MFRVFQWHSHGLNGDFKGSKEVETRNKDAFAKSEREKQVVQEGFPFQDGKVQWLLTEKASRREAKIKDIEDSKKQALVRVKNELHVI